MYLVNCHKIIVLDKNNQMKYHRIYKYEKIFKVLVFFAKELAFLDYVISEAVLKIDPKNEMLYSIVQLGLFGSRSKNNMYIFYVVPFLC